MLTSASGPSGGVGNLGSILGVDITANLLGDRVLSLYSLSMQLVVT
jgi:hypothetical protein